MPDFPRNQFKPAIDDILKSERAWIASTDDSTIGYFQQVAMIGRETCATELTPLFYWSRLTKTPQSLDQIASLPITLGTPAR